MSFRFEPDHRFAESLKRQPEYVEGTARIAVAVAQNVRTGAPRHTGHYVRSIEARGNSVVSTDSFAHLVEWGSANNPAYAPIRRGVLAAGLRLDESRL